MSLSRSKLSPSQMKEIEESLAHLLDFSDEPLLFSQQEAALMEALTGTVTNDHDYFFVAKCLKKPGKFYRYLEQQGSAEDVLTIGDVQDAIIQHIHQCLSSKGLALQHWDTAKILKILPTENRTKPFTTQKARVESDDNLWQLPVLTDSIYTQSLKIKEIEEPNMFYPYLPAIETISQEVWVKVALHDDPDITTYHTVFVETLNLDNLKNENPQQLALIAETEDEEMQQLIREGLYRQQVLEKAADIARLRACKDVFKILDNQKCVVHPRHKNHILKNEGLQTTGQQSLITRRYWFDLLLHGQLRISEIYGLKPEVTEVLNCPVVIDLCREGLLTFGKAKNIPLHAIDVIRHPVYFPLIKDKTIRYDTLCKLSQSRAQFLTTSFVSHLVQRKKITFAQARLIPAHLQSFFQDKSWLTYCETHKVNWERFCEIPDSDACILLEPTPLRLLNNNIISLQDICTAINEKNENSVFFLLTTAFARRLYGFCDHKIHVLDSQADTIDIIYDELEEVAKDYDFELMKWKTEIFSILLDYLLDNFYIKIAALDEDDPRADIYDSMINLIMHDAGKEDDKWLRVFNKLSDYAGCTRESIRITELQSPPENRTSSNLHLLFPHKRKKPSPDTDIKDICDGILAIAEISQPLETLTPSLSFSQ